MNTARKFNHENVYKQLDSLEMKQTAVLTALIGTPNSDIIEAIIYWMTKKTNADEAGVAICNNQIDLLERQMMAITIIKEDLLGSVELTGGIPTIVESPVEVSKETVVKSTKEETPVIDIKTKKPVKEVVTETKEEVATETKVETVAETVKEETPAVTERKSIDAIKAEVTELIQSGKKDEGYALYAAYMKKGMFLDRKGRAGKPWNDKELKNAWAALLKKSEIEVVKEHVEATEKPADTGSGEKEVVETKAVETTEVKADVDFEKATLELTDKNLVTYKKFYPNDTEAEKNVVTFTKSNRNVGEEEKIIANIYNEVCALIANNQMNDAAELTRLFFSERAYDDVQVGKWISAASLNTNIKNQLAFLHDSVTLKESDSIADMVQMATNAVKNDKASKETVFAWFKSNAFGKKLKDVDKVIDDEPSLLAKFKATMEWIFESKPDHTPTAIIRVTEILTEKLKEAKPGENTFVDVTSTTQAALKAEGFKFSLKELLPKAKELSKTVNPEFLKAFENRKNFLGQPVGPAKVETKVDPIEKAAETFEKGEELKENPTSPSLGTEEIASSTTSEEKVETVEAEVVITKMDELMYHLTMMSKETKDVEAIKLEALKYMVTQNCIEDAPGWTNEQVGLMVDGLLNPAEEETHPVSESGEPAATVTETAAPVATVETAATEEKKEIIISKTTSTLDVDLRSVTKADNKTKFAEAIKVAYTNNDKRLSNDEFIAAVIAAIKAPGSGKYVQNIAKNKVEQTSVQIKNIIETKL